MSCLLCCRKINYTITENFERDFNCLIKFKSFKQTIRNILTLLKISRDLKNLANAVPDIQEEISEDVWKELFTLLQED